VCAAVSLTSTVYHRTSATLLPGTCPATYVAAPANLSLTESMGEGCGVVQRLQVTCVDRHSVESGIRIQ
jgi:hypothetical protein